MKDGIRLHPKYGVNPSLLVCHLCGEATGVALLGYNHDKEAPPKVLDHQLCKSCKAKVVGRIKVIGVNDDHPSIIEAYAYLSTEAAKRIFEGPKLKDILEQSVVCVPMALFNQMRQAHEQLLKQV